MTRKQALADLIAKVEAGDLIPDNLIVSSEVSAMIDLAVNVSDLHGDVWADLCAAYDGSLDAAKALHEAMLGDGYVSDGYKWCMWGSGKVSVWHVIKGWHHVGDVPNPHYHAASPARAWLLAILLALHSMEPDT